MSNAIPQIRHISLLLKVSFILAWAAGFTDSQIAIADEPEPKILVHYMPWYLADAKAKEWGWHWTMNHFDPNSVRADGRREIASHHYPLIGPYDSEDPHVLEYHALLMKFSGIDGVIFDWFGTSDFWDNRKIDRSTRALIPWLKKAGLLFTFCYEDQTVKHMINEGAINEADGIDETVGEFDKLADKYFRDSSWVKSGGEPILLIFGPQHFTPRSWRQVMRRSKSPPVVYGLPHAPSELELGGIYAWPPVEGVRKISVERWKKSLRSTYEKGKGKKMIPVAFPEFHDIYAEAKVQKGYGHLEDRDGATLTESLDLAKETKPEFIQIVTWNDYGEGTTIEPTRDFGYRYLEILIDASPKRGLSKKNLELPLALFKLRKSDDASADAVADALFNGNFDVARKLLKNER